MSVLLASGARSIDDLDVSQPTDLPRLLLVVFGVVAKLVEVSLAPGVHFSLAGDAGRVSESGSNVCEGLFELQFVRSVDVLLRFVSVVRVVTTSVKMALLREH